jgi:hypothetical protein
MDAATVYLSPWTNTGSFVETDSHAQVRSHLTPLVQVHGLFSLKVMIRVQGSFWGTLFSVMYCNVSNNAGHS